MKTTDFAKHLTMFLTSYLPGQKGYSTNTIISYRDTFKFLLSFIEEKYGIRSEKLTLQHIDDTKILAFLGWLEKERGCSPATRNQRLFVIHSFVKYVRKNEPGFLYMCQKILDIDSKKTDEATVSYITPDEAAEILAQPDINSRYGRRDAVLLALLYDSAARVQELCDLRVRDVRVKPPYTVTLTGKGSKTRSVPIMKDTADVIAKYLAENNLTSPENLDRPLFLNNQRSKLTRAGIAYILNKYADSARTQKPTIPQMVSPHVIRHSKAMHMLQANINIVYIRDFLGHVHVKTTEVYAKADTESKRKAIENARIPVSANLPDWSDDKPLMQMLTDLCR
jgi:site-specific recombinase XerD